MVAVGSFIPLGGWAAAVDRSQNNNFPTTAVLHVPDDISNNETYWWSLTIQE